MRRRAVAIGILAVLAAAGARASEPYDENAIVSYLKGAYLESQNDFYGAYQYYLYAAARDPDNPRILLRLARVAAQVGDYDRSKAYAERILESGEYGTEARLVLAEVEYRLGELERSLAVLGDLRGRTDVPLPEVLAFYARVAMELGKRAEAMAALEEAVKLDASDASVWFELGLLRAEAGENGAAEAALSKAIEVKPNHAGARLALARLYARLGRRAESKREYRETLQIDPFSRSAVKELTDILYEDGEYAEGAALLDPFFRDGRLEEGGEIIYGRFLYRAGRTEDALAVFGKLLTTMGDRPPILRVMAEMEIERGRFRTALGYLKRLIAAEPGRFENYVGVLVLLYAPPSPPAAPEESVELAQADIDSLLLEAAELVAEDSAEHNYLMGTILRKAGELERAEPFLLQAERLDPKNENTIIEIASLYSRMGRYDDALRRIVPLYNRNEDDASIANFYGYLLAEKGESLDLAEKLVRKALDKEPQNGYFLDSLGWILFKKGLVREALDILNTAAAKAGDDPVIWEHIGDAHVRLNEKVKAREAYRKSLELDPESRTVGDKLKGLGER